MALVAAIAPLAELAPEDEHDGGGGERASLLAAARAQTKPGANAVPVVHAAVVLDI